MPTKKPTPKPKTKTRWQGGVVELKGVSTADGDELMCVMAFVTETHELLAYALSEPGGDLQRLLPLFDRALASPLEGRRHRPGEIWVADADLATLLRKHLKASGDTAIRVSTRKTPLLDGFAEQLKVHLVAQGALVEVS